MVAPEHEFPARSERRGRRIATAFAGPARGAEELLQGRRLSLALRAGAAFVFGTAFLWPAIPETMVIRLFAAYAFVDGMLALAPGGWNSPQRLGWPLLVGGIIDIAGACAVYVWLWLGMTLAQLADIGMMWAIGSGIAFTWACLSLRASDTEQLFLLGGIASLVFGRALLSQLAADPVVLSTWIGLYATTMAVLFLKMTLKHYRVTLL